MKYFLDTNICIYYLKGMYPKLKEKLLNHNPEMIVIPSITKAELLYGAEKSQRKEENLEKINEFLLPYCIQGFNDAETTTYAIIRKELEEILLFDFGIWWGYFPDEKEYEEEFKIKKKKKKRLAILAIGRRDLYSFVVVFDILKTSSEMLEKLEKIIREFADITRLDYKIIHP